MKPRQPAQRRARCQFRQASTWEMREPDRLLDRAPSPLPAEGFFHGTTDRGGTVSGTRRRRPRSDVRSASARAELTAAYVCEYCFGPLEVLYDMERDRRHGHAASASPPGRRRSGATATSCPARRRTRPPACPTGMTPLVRAPRLAEALGLRDVWVKNDTANPTHSFKDRVVSVALEKAKQLGYRVVACASTGNLANSVAAHASAARPRELRLRAGRPRGAEDRGDRRSTAPRCWPSTATTTTSTGSAWSWPSDRPWAFVNVNVRPYYSEGSKTLAYEVAEQLGWTLPDRCIVPIASGSLYTKINRGFRDLLETGLVEGERAGAERRPGRRLRAGGRRLGRGRPRLRLARCGRTRSPRAWPSATRPTASSRSTWPAPPAAPSRRSPRRRSSRASSCSPRTTGIFTETAGGVTTAVLTKLARRRGDRPRRARRRLHHRRRPQDPRRGRRPRPAPPHRSPPSRASRPRWARPASSPDRAGPAKETTCP